ncbi:hypothetical protein LEP1GSC016_1326 [Leptospira borgpetersenii serovar Hardjo-bovis str. Sponselee]|uniref:Uncharacterized protein n=1 Tax=Leptospira borgpetersenii serovar Hardjo-bovis str. Sponselee TaxID=1303729 RepID=M6BGZ1_LEPBO|nr:hypothetical protein LEP1GSC016_1326 [Leptospira borgpetersenii serovar Hardjo-bovis str. Sponselee]
MLHRTHFKKGLFVILNVFTTVRSGAEFLYSGNRAAFGFGFDVADFP